MVRTGEYVVDPRAAGGHVGAHLGVNRIQVGKGHFPERNAALVRDDDHQVIERVEKPNPIDNGGQQAKLRPILNVVAFQLFVDDPIAVEEYAAAAQKRSLPM